MNHYVYIIYSQALDRYYIGCSKDPQTRVRYHNQGKSGSKQAFTKRAKDWKMVWVKNFNTKHEAILFEIKLKRMKSRKYIETLIKK